MAGSRLDTRTRSSAEARPPGVKFAAAGQTEGMATMKSDLASEVAGYAAIFHDAIGYRHHVASPLGAWLLLALCAPAATGTDAATLTRLLGADAAGAAAQAADLLAAPHPLVAAAAAVWSQPGAVGRDWLASLPASVAQG